MKNLQYFILIGFLVSCSTSPSSDDTDDTIQIGFLRGLIEFDFINDIDDSITKDPIPGIPGVTQTRIPSILQLASGRILAMFDARSTSQADAANDIDTGLRYSDNGGENWGVGQLVNYYEDFALENAASAGRKQDSSSFIDSSPVQAENGDVISISTLFPAGSGIQGGARHPADNPFIHDGTKRYLRLTKTSEYPYQGSKADDKTKFLYQAPVEGGAITKILDGSETGYTIDKYWFIFQDGDPVEVDQRNAKTPTKIHANIAFANAPFRNIRSSYIALNRSTDNGKTWDTPIDISHFFRPTTDNQHYIVSPGVGHRIREGEDKGRLVYVLYETPGNADAPSSPNTLAKCNAFSIYSDDDGDTWKQGGYTKIATSGGLDKASESQVVEAPGGQLLMYSRGGKRISLAHSVDGGETWTDAVDTGMYNGQSSGTQFGVINLYLTTGANNEALAAMIHPNHSTVRRDGTIRTGEFKKSGQKVPDTDEDEWVIEWDKTKSVYAHSQLIAPSTDNFGYSTVTELRSGDLGVFFEGRNSYTTGAGELNFGIVKLDRELF